MSKPAAAEEPFSPLIFVHDLKPLIQEAVAKAEAHFPPHTNLVAEVEMTEEMTVKIVVKPDTENGRVQ